MAGKISEYTNAVATFADGDLVDVSKRISTSPDTFQSQKLEFAQFQAFIQANASNILNTNGLTLGGNYSHNLNTNSLTFTNGNINLDGKFAISATDEGILLPRLTTAQKIAISTPDLNLVVFDTDLNSLQRYNGSSWVSLSGYGILSLMNSAGEPSFYSSYNSAIAVASSGDTIQQFGNIEDSSSTTINIDKSLTINLNGFTYTNSSTGASDCIQVSTTDKVKILNGTIKRINGTYGTTSNRALTLTANGDLEVTGTDIINDTGLSLYSTGTGAKVLNGRFSTTNQTITKFLYSRQLR